jgi:hypothetical protein
MSFTAYGGSIALRERNERPHQVEIVPSEELSAGQKVTRLNHNLAALERPYNDRGVSHKFAVTARGKKMTFIKTLATFTAIASLAAPAMADVRTAAFADGADRSPIQTSVFAGATLRIGLDRKSGEPRHRASLGISGMALDPATSSFQVGQGIELSLSGAGKPALMLGGSDAGDLWRTANMSGGGKAALIVGGVALALGVAALVAVDTLRCEDEDGGPCD